MVKSSCKIDYAAAHAKRGSDAAVDCTAGLTGTIANVSTNIRANLQLFQLGGTHLQTPCATPSEVPDLKHTYCCFQTCPIAICFRP